MPRSDDLHQKLNHASKFRRSMSVVLGRIGGLDLFICEARVILPEATRRTHNDRLQDVLNMKKRPKASVVANQTREPFDRIELVSVDFCGSGCGGYAPIVEPAAPRLILRFRHRSAKRALPYPIRQEKNNAANSRWLESTDWLLPFFSMIRASTSSTQMRTRDMSYE